MPNDNSIFIDLISWSRESLDLWQQDALRRLFEKPELDTDDIEDIFKLCKTGNDIVVEGDLPQPLVLQEVSQGNLTTPEKIALRMLSNVSNVNALASNQTLIFQREGITIVYGGNGTGKSGYARILKKVCRARADSEILQNVYEDNQNPPSARIEYFVNEQRTMHDWQLNASAPDQLNHISIFDSSCATIHIDNSNDVAYTPKALDILAKLAQASREMKNKLESEVGVYRRDVPDFITNNKSRDYTATGLFLRELSWQTSSDGVDALTNISEEKNKRHKELLDLLQNDPLVQIKKLNVKRQKIDGIITSVEHSYGKFNQDSIVNLKNLYDDVEAKEKVASVAADELFKSEPLAGIGSEVWQQLWEAARKYSEVAYKDLGFPFAGDDSRCLLCQQVLSSEAGERLSRFEKFVKDDTQEQVQAAKQNLAQELEDIKTCQITRKNISNHYNFIKVDLENQSLAKALRRYLAGIYLSLKNINQASQSSDIKEYELNISYIVGLKEIEKEIEGHIDELKESLDPEGRKRLETELAEIEDKIWISVHKDSLLAEIEKLKLIHKYNLSIGETDTRNITLKSTELANVLVTNALRDRFTQELNNLGINHLRAELVQQGSSYGIPKFKVQLIRNPSAHIGKVLSEGEYRNIAIAAFLTELSTSEHNSGMVFDDPVCSLDHDYRHKIADRLVKESTERQVVIFTHDISFVFMVQASAKAHNIPVFYQALDKSSTNSGVCQSKPPFQILPVDDALSQLEEYLNQVKALHEKGRVDEWELKLDSLSIRIRKCWELAVETVLSPVFRRFSYKVDTKGLIKMSVLTDDDCRIMRGSYGRISQWEHSEAPSMGSPLPTPVDVQQEITVLRNWYNDIETRQSGISNI